MAATARRYHDQSISSRHPGFALPGQYLTAFQSDLSEGAGLAAFAPPGGMMHPIEHPGNPERAILGMTDLNLLPRASHVFALPTAVCSELALPNDERRTHLIDLCGGGTHARGKGCGRQAISIRPGPCAAVVYRVDNKRRRLTDI